MLGSSVDGVVLNHGVRAVPGEDYPVKIERFGEPDYIKNGLSLVASYVRATADGDCGLPYLIPSRFAKPIVGIHTWLTEGMSLVGAAPLVLSELERAKADLNLPVVAVTKEVFPIAIERVQNKYWHTNMELVGHGKFGDWSVQHYTPQKSKFARCTYRGIHVAHPEWDCDFLPAAQRVVGDIHPMFTNAQKYEYNAVFSVNLIYHHHAVAHFSGKYERQRDTHIFSLHEAINGVPPMQPVRTDTSSGFWSEFGFKEGKKHFLEELPQETDAYGQLEPVQYKLSAKAKQHEVPMFGVTFEQRLRDVETNARNAIASVSPWVSTTKDELLKAAKVAIGKTRVFEQPGFEYTLLVRKYFGAFLNYYKSRAGFVFYHGIGMDKDEIWNEYWKEMNRLSPTGIDFDFANYDGTVHQSAFQFFLDVVENYYHDSTQEERNARAALLDMLRETYHIMGNQLAYSIKGNKSGNPFTDVFNSITNTYMQYVAFMACVQGSDVNLQLFDDGVRMLTYGDDIIQAIRPDLQDRFNGRRVKDALGPLGYKITDAAKSAEMTTVKPLTELTFLKSPFVERDGVCWSPLPKREIYKELKWRPACWEGNDEDLRLRLLVTQKFMCHHGPTALQQFKADLLERGLPRKWLCVDYDTERLRIRALQENAVLYSN